MNTVHAHVDDSEVVSLFMALGPTDGQKYTVFTLTTYNRLSEVPREFDSHGPQIWAMMGRVFVDFGIVYNNTYMGERTPPQQIK